MRGTAQLPQQCVTVKETYLPARIPSQTHKDADTRSRLLSLAKMEFLYEKKKKIKHTAPSHTRHTLYDMNSEEVPR